MKLDLYPVHQRVNTERIADIPAAVRHGLAELPLDDYVRPGMRIALTGGSRGISGIGEVMQTLVAELRARGAEPFMVAAMGSHGGGTPAGQRQVLESYGLGEKDLGIPVSSSMETIEIGQAPKGIRVFFDAAAATADGIIPINRIKEHTAFKGRWESGLLKMMAVGLGKARGAAEIHNWGVRDTMPAVARVILQRMPILFGVGIVENGHHEAARIAVLPPERIEEEEAELLQLARRLTPRIPLEPLDLLVVQEMGKEISGTGMDLNVIGIWRRTGGPIEPAFHVIGVLDLTAKTHGNAIGVGHADLITQRLRDKVDLAVTYKNVLTAHNLPGGKIPVTLADDRELFETGLAGVPLDRARVVYVKNTLELDHLWVSRALLPAVADHPALEPVGEPVALVFDKNGTLCQPEFAPPVPP
jgi:hypothetical protein